jgi:hypothetical protein
LAKQSTLAQQTTSTDVNKASTTNLSRTNCGLSYRSSSHYFIPLTTASGQRVASLQKELGHRLAAIVRRRSRCIASKRIEGRKLYVENGSEDLQ